VAAGSRNRRPPVFPEEGSKSIGHEITFEHDTADLELLHRTLLELAGRVAGRLRSNGARARTIAIKYREADFTTYTRRTTLNAPVNTAESIFPAAEKLMKSLWSEGALVRLVGIYASNLEIEAAGKQMSLLSPPPERDQNWLRHWIALPGVSGARRSLAPSWSEEKGLIRRLGAVFLKDSKTLGIDACYHRYFVCGVDEWSSRR